MNELRVRCASIMFRNVRFTVIITVGRFVIKNVSSLIIERFQRGIIMDLSNNKYKSITIKYYTVCLYGYIVIVIEPVIGTYSPDIIIKSNRIVF